MLLEDSANSCFSMLSSVLEGLFDDGCGHVAKAVLQFGKVRRCLLDLVIKTETIDMICEIMCVRIADTGINHITCVAKGMCIK